MSARKEIAYLVGSECRLEVIRELAETPARPTELAERCSCARETIQRALAGFVERSWAEKNESRYRLTASGEIVLEQYEAMADTVTAVDRLDEFLSHAGEVGRTLDPTLLAELTVTSACEGQPHAPIERYLSILGGESPTRFHGFMPVASQVFNQAAESAIGPETSVELVIDETVLETSKREFPRALQRAHDLDQMSLYVSAEAIEFGLAIVDDHACVGAYDDTGNLVVTVDGTDETFLSWAEETFERYRSCSECVTSSTPSATDAQR